MGYRDELTALEARRDAITAELRERGGLELAAELSETERRVGLLRRRILGTIRIASACDATWAAMEGEGPVRHCHRCEKKVYDLAGLSSEAAVTLLAREGDPACMRLHRRRDGTVITTDCLLGRERHRRRGLAIAGGVLLSAAALATTLAPSLDDPYEPPFATIPTMGSPMIMMGEPALGDPEVERPPMFDEEAFLHGWPDEDERPERRVGPDGD